MLDLTTLNKSPRLLLHASLRPVQSERFQPTGFPDLGAAMYKLHDGTAMLLVESAQSMANRTEAVCWDEAKGDLVPALSGLPYLHVDVVDKAGVKLASTASLLEAHRINSPYVLLGQLDGKPFEMLFLAEVKCRDGVPVDRREFVRAIFKYDPGSLLHGVFMSNIGDGRMRLSRALSSFIEARNVRVAQSGGVKNDRINASGDTKEGFGNVPFARTEYTAESISAFLNLDLRQLRSYGLPDEATTLLQLLGLYKFRTVLRDGLRLRTACDLKLAKGEILVEEPTGFRLPEIADIEAALPKAIAACGKLFADPRVTRLRFESSAASAKKSKKAEQAE